MPSVPRILEILVYSLTGFLPWLMLALYPFRERLRFSGDLIAIVAAVLAAAQITADVALGLGMMGNSFLVHLVLVLIYAAFCFGAIRAPYLQIAVNTALILALALIGTCAAKALTVSFALALPYSWVNTLILLVLEVGLAAAYFPLCRQLNRLLGKQESLPAEAAEPEVPVEEPPVEELAPEEELPEAPAELPDEPMPEEPVSDPEPAATTATIKLPRFHLSLRSAPAADTSTKRLQALQYHDLRSRIGMTSQLRRDLSRQLSTLSAQLNSKEYDKLRASLAALREEYPAEAPACCGQPALNGILTYFLAEAKACGVKMTANVQVPDELALEETELTVLLGNLLDNALDACRAQSGPDRRVTVSGHQYGQALRFVVENTYDQPVRQDKQGNYLSTKYDAPGAGLEVVQAIAERHGGTLKIDHTNGIFQATVTLNL